MRYVFQFVGGPLDGNYLHYDPAATYLGDLGAKAFQDTDGANVGKQFGVINPDTPPDHQGIIERLREFIYQTVSVRTDSEKHVIRSEYVAPRRHE